MDENDIPYFESSIYFGCGTVKKIKVQNFLPFNVQFQFSEIKIKSLQIHA